MNYNQVSISNLALGRIGARGQLTSINENSPNAVKVLAVWDAIFQEVLSERDWKFAKTRVNLQLSPVRPLYAYRHAWALPADFLRFVRPHKRPPNPHHFAWFWGPEGFGWYHRHDPPFWPHDWPYVVETIAAAGACPPQPAAIVQTGCTPCTPPPCGKFALTDYGGFHGPAKINYIRLITDYTQLMPGFVNCLANRLAMELSIGITEDKNKFQLMEERYKDSLNSAEAQNESSDFQQDEAGSDSWERAGRFGRCW